MFSSASHRKYTEENVSKGRDRERERRGEASLHTQKKTKHKFCCVVWEAGACLSASSGNAYLLVAILQASASRSEADIRLRIVRLFVFAKCFLFESISM